MGSMSIWHWVIVLLVVVLLFGTKKLGNMGSDIGKAVKGVERILVVHHLDAGQVAQALEHHFLVLARNKDVAIAQQRIGQLDGTSELPPAFVARTIKGLRVEPHLDQSRDVLHGDMVAAGNGRRTENIKDAGHQRRPIIAA